MAFDKQIDQDLPQPIFVGLDHAGRRPMRDMAEFDAFRRRLQPEHVDDLVEEIRSCTSFAVEIKAAGLDLGDIQQPVDQPREVFAAAPMT